MSARVRFTVVGDKELIADMMSLGAVGIRTGKFKVRELAFRAAVRAQDLAPTEDGHLRDSIRVTPVSYSKTSGTISATVVAGGQPLEAHLGKRKQNLSAIVQHDDLTLKHDDGQAKFVEVPALQEYPKLPEELRRELDRFIDAKTGDSL